MPARLPRSVERYLFRDFLPRLRGDTCIRICTKLYQLGDPDHPDYGLSCRQASGFGVMVSFKVDTHKRALAVLERVRLVLFAESLGGTESLVTYPLVQTHGSILGRCSTSWESMSACCAFRSASKTRRTLSPTWSRQ